MKAMKPQECNELLEKAFNDQDIEMVMSLFAENAIFTDQEGKEHIGLEAIRKAEQTVIDLNPDFHIDTIGVTTYEDIAVLRSKWQLRGTLPNNKPIKLAHNGIEVVKRQKDGSWLYVIDNPFFAE